MMVRRGLEKRKGCAMKRSKCAVFAVLASVFLCAGMRPACAGTTWYVDDDTPADFATIQAALDASSDGDTIIVRDGTYTGDGNRDIDFKGKAVHLRPENGPQNCVIDCQQSGRGFYFHSDESSDSVVDGFTIKNGRQAGGGIYCYESSPTITNNTIRGNRSANYGGGIYCKQSWARIINNVITDNAVSTHGGGIYCISSSLTIANNTITANASSAAGGGIFCELNSGVVLTHNTITENTADMGGGVYCAS